MHRGDGGKTDGYGVGETGPVDQLLAGKQQAILAAAEQGVIEQGDDIGGVVAVTERLDGVVEFLVVDARRDRDVLGGDGCEVLTQVDVDAGHEKSL
ncbi:hypothetical protein D3C84_1050980 [compost metagenome]